MLELSVLLLKSSYQDFVLLPFYFVAGERKTNDLEEEVRQ